MRLSLDELRDLLAARIAYKSMNGDPISLSLHGYALDIGIDVQAIIDNPEEHTYV